MDTRLQKLVTAAVELAILRHGLTDQEGRDIGDGRRAVPGPQGLERGRLCRLIYSNNPRPSSPRAVCTGTRCGECGDRVSRWRL